MFQTTIQIIKNIFTKKHNQKEGISRQTKMKQTNTQKLHISQRSTFCLCLVYLLCFIFCDFRFLMTLSYILFALGVLMVVFLQ